MTLLTDIQRVVRILTLITDIFSESGPDIDLNYAQRDEIGNRTFTTRAVQLVYKVLSISME